LGWLHSAICLYGLAGVVEVGAAVVMLRRVAASARVEKVVANIVI